VLNRHREHSDEGYVYYVGKKPEQVDHFLSRVDFFIALASAYDLNTFQCKLPFGNVRPDAYAEVVSQSSIKPILLELQRRNSFEQDKYEKEYYRGEWKKMWNKFPIVAVVGPHKFKIRPSPVQYVIGSIDEVVEKIG